MQNLNLLIKELISLPTETEWLEFKHNNFDPAMIGADISALANSAAYRGKDKAYMIWGINNETHEILGTNYNRFSKLINNQEIESWIKNTVSKNADFDFFDTEIDDKKLAAKTDLQKDEIFKLLDFACYFDLQNIALPSNQEGMLHYVLEDEIVLKQDNSLYTITNLGAILFAKRIADFPTLARKAIRVVQYENDTKLKILKEYNGTKGYAVGFEGLMEFLEALLPSEEVITETVRKTVTKFPMIALREIIANALIHQDFTVSGSSPLVEIFQSRIEVTNPGIPLVDINRFIDNPPKSRNETLSSLMRRLKMCEELGSGWDRIALECELKQLPAPKILLYEENTKVILFSGLPFANIPHEEKLWSCYLHACIKYVMGERMTNLSLRKRMHVEEKNKAAISRLISEAMKENLIKPFDKDTAPRYMSYIPIWA